MIDMEVAKALANEIVDYISERGHQKEEKFLKETKPKKNKKGEVTNGAIIFRLLSIIKTLGENKEEIKKIESAKKPKWQTPLGFQQNKYNQLLSLLNDEVDNQLHDLKNDYQDFLLKNKEDHNPVNWLTKWSVKASDISFATHVAKLTHSSSKSSSILDVTAEKDDRYLTTNSLVDIKIDTASSNAASLPIADILKIEVGGISVLNCIKNNDKTLFRNLTDDESLIDEWCNQLKQAYDSMQKQSYFLSKQTYFPVKDNQYHLLLPLTSSSLVHELHLEHKKYWEEEQKVAKTQKKEKRYSAISERTYPKKAYLHVTGSNHSNASSLNGKRGGRISLLPTMPPQWKPNPPSCVKKLSIFDKTLWFELENEINDLKKYLLLIKNKSLSISEPNRNATVVSKLQSISSNFFNYLEMINSNCKQGWTCESSLPIEQQLLFEPWRKDTAAVKINKKWKNTLSQSYGRWLNKQIKQKDKLVLTPIHEALWSNIFLIELREFIATQEVKL